MTRNYNSDEAIDLHEFPSIIWRKEYETSPRKMLGLVQHISDYLLLVSSQPWNMYKNPSFNYSMLEGNMKDTELKKEFEGLLYAYGDEGPGELNDYKFYKTEFEAIEGTVLKMPFEVSFKSVTRSYEEKKFSKALDRLTAFMRNAAIDQAIAETGENLESLKDPDANNISKLDHLIAEMNAPDELEFVSQRLLRNAHFRFDMNNEFKKSNKHHFAVNAMFAMVDTTSGYPRLKSLDPRNVRYISPVQVETMDDPNIIAWSVQEYISIDNALQRYGDQLATHKKMDTVRKIIKYLRAGARDDESLYYNPYRYADGYEPFLAKHEAGDGYDFLVSEKSMKTFYGPLTSDTTRGNVPYGILEQKIYFKVIKYDRVLVLVNGKNPSKEDVARMKHGIVVDNVSFRLVSDDYVAKPNEMIRNKPYEELWEATRLGHAVFVNIQKYKYTTRYEKQERKVFPPIIGRIVDADSMVSLSKSFYIAYHKMMYLFDEKANAAGAENVLLYDKAQAAGKSLKDTLLSAKKFGAIEFDSSLFTMKENTMAAKHLSFQSLNSGVKDMIEYLKAAEIIKQTWATSVGLTPQMKGDTGQYESAAKIDRVINQSSIVLHSYMWNDYLFRRDALQRYSDILRAHVAENPGLVSLFWGKSEREVVRITKELSTVDMEMQLSYGYEALADKQYLEQVANAAISAGSGDLLTAIDVRMAETPAEIAAIIRKTMKETQERQLQMQQSQQQAMAQEMEIKKAKDIDVPLQREHIKAEAARYVADARNADSQANRDHQGDMYDIKEVNDRQRSVLDSALNAENQAQNPLQQQ